MSHSDRERREGRWRWRIGNALHWLAFFWLAIALCVVLLGGIYWEVFGVLFRATRLTNPLIFCVGCTILGRFAAPTLPLGGTPIVRLARWLKPGRDRSRLLRFAITMATILGLLGLRVYHWHHERLAMGYVASGHNALAAEHFARAVGPLSPAKRRLHDKRADALFRAGAFDEVVELLEPAFAAGQRLTTRGYRALWRAYTELARYDKAVAVVQEAMGKFASMGTECAGVLAQLELRMQGLPDHPSPVQFVFDSAVAHDNIFLAGNWNSSGKPSEVHGWSPVPMQSEDGLRWVLDASLAPSQVFSYVAMAFASPEILSDRALGLVHFHIKGAIDGEPQRIELQAAPPVGTVHASAERLPGTDGRQRVLAIWPDAGSWYLINDYVHRGLMPNMASLLQRGARGRMISTHPPFTSTAYVRMVDLQPGRNEHGDTNLWETVLIQLKGIPFLDGLIPDSLVTPEQSLSNIFTILSNHGHTAINLVFNDRYIAAPNDLSINNAELRIQEPKLDYSAKGIVHDLLLVDRSSEPGRTAAMLEETVFLMGIENTQEKVELGVQIWQQEQPDFMLLRFPAVDILSHRYYSSAESSPLWNLMLETYRHFDMALGRFIALLDQDDTLIVVSDHGIQGSLLHHPDCVLVVEGPSVEPRSTFDTIPIGHFPSVVLSRFGITEGAERLSADTFRFFYGRPALEEHTASPEANREVVAQ